MQPGCADSLIRLSTGLEDAEDLIEDLRQALDAVVVKSENSYSNSIMETHKQLTIGLFGFGVVGEGLYKVLQQTPSLKATIKKVCIKHPGKKREAPAELFTTDREVILNDPEINVIVEVINESGPAFEIVSTGAAKRQIGGQREQENDRGAFARAVAAAAGDGGFVPYMRRRPVRPFRSSVTWRNIMTMTCCTPSRRS